MARAPGERRCFAIMGSAAPVLLPGALMQILLPIAGAGTRVRPHTHVRPKPMLSLAGKPVLGHLLDSLMPLRPSSLILVVGDGGEEIEAYVREHYAVPVHVGVQQELKGQSHAIKQVEEFIREPVLIVFGDTIFDAALDQIVDPAVDGAIVVKPVEDPSRFGVVELHGGLITRLVEKPPREAAPSHLAVIGVYMLNDFAGLKRAIDEQIAAEDALKGEFFIAGALQRMIDAGARLKAVTAAGWWDTGTIDAVLETHRHLVEQHRRKPEYTPVSIVIEPCYIDPSAKLERCAVGPYVTVGPNAEIVESVLSDAIVGEGARLRGQCLRWSIVGHNAELDTAPLSVNVSDHSTIAQAPPHGAGH
jgi:glucose-1-phosphate thymidylyltransferase